MTPDAPIPNRARFKPSEVCSIAGVQPYILRSWEAEFPALGTNKGKSAARVYRRSDVELVLKIKSLVFGEGLTLGAARRKLEASAPDARPSADVEPGDLFESDDPERCLDEVKKGLREILAMLSVSGEVDATRESADSAALEPTPVDTEVDAEKASASSVASDDDDGALSPESKARLAGQGTTS